MILLLCAALADPPAPGPLPTIELDGKTKVLIDGERAPLTRARVYLIADPGSHDLAKKAKRTGLMGRVTTVVGASFMVLGFAAMAQSEDVATGVGPILLGGAGMTAGSIVSGSSLRKWRNSVELYQGPVPAP
ncbi:MAG: hypothetical protein H6737_14620 [Alphaproteobacteria bacterium]|nr:hypothetical protein [Alphaproteobacteria bacterium]